MFSELIRDEGTLVYISRKCDRIFCLQSVSVGQMPVGQSVGRSGLKGLSRAAVVLYPW